MITLATQVGHDFSHLVRPDNDELVIHGVRPRKRRGRTNKKAGGGGGGTGEDGGGMEQLDVVKLKELGEFLVSLSARQFSLFDTLIKTAPSTFLKGVGERWPSMSEATRAIVARKHFRPPVPIAYAPPSPLVQDPFAYHHRPAAPLLLTHSWVKEEEPASSTHSSSSITAHSSLLTSPLRPYSSGDNALASLPSLPTLPSLPQPPSLPRLGEDRAYDGSLQRIGRLPVLPVQDDAQVPALESS